MKHITTSLLLLTVLYGYSQSPLREFRGAWIATVANIDFPSKQGLDVQSQQAELTRWFDLMKEYKLNTAILQIRPTADALYHSALEPASHWITGKQDTVLPYDPLQFAIEQARRRGLSLHVWLNPYRVLMDTADIALLSPQHLYYRQPELFVTYGKTLYFNPALEQSREFLAEVVKDIITRYQVEGIHMDDYFYPYPLKGQEFPDTLQYQQEQHTFDNIGDWRRNNVNLMIQRVAAVIREHNPSVEFGISPFGVWRNQSADPQGSDTKAGISNYDHLYADILLWQRQHWIDYVVPQLYWHIGFNLADYRTLAIWWNNNALNCNLYIGQAPYRINKQSKTKSWRTAKEIIRQVEINRSLPNIKGSVFFSMKSLKSDVSLDLQRQLTKKYYSYEAIVPECKTKQPIIPEVPSDVITTKVDKSKEILVMWKGGSNSRRFVIYKVPKNKPLSVDDPSHIIAVTGETSFRLQQPKPKKYNYYITALSATQTQSDWVTINISE